MDRPIEKWMLNTIGVRISLGSPEFSVKLHNGYVFFLILKKYGLLDESTIDEFERFGHTREPYINLRKLCPWFKMLGVPHSLSDLKDISQKDSHKCLHLLVSLYGKLGYGKKDSHNIITDLKIQKVLNSQAAHKSIKEPDLKSITLPKVPFDNKNKYEKMAKRSVPKQKVVSHKKETPVKTELNKDNKKPKYGGPYVAKTSSEEAVISYCVNPLTMPKWDKTNEELLKLKMTNLLLLDLWGALLVQNEKDFRSFFQEKMTKHCEYEKKLATELAKSYKYFHSRFPQNVTFKSEKSEFIIKNDVLRQKGIEISKNEKSIMELHNKLYQEKTAHRKIKNLEMCRTIVMDLIDYAMIKSEYNEDNGCPPSRAVLNDWKELFYKGIKLFDLNTEWMSTAVEEESVLNEDVISFKDIKMMDTQMLQDRTIVEALTKFDVHSYLYLVGQWMVENYPELEIGREKLNIHGYAVHRLLECKYPLPSSDVLPYVDHFEIRCVIRYFHDPRLIDQLQKLLNKPNVLIVKFKDALNYCVRTYKMENSIVAMKKTDSIYSKKSLMEKKLSITSTRSSFTKKGSLEVESVAIPQSNKAVQYPEVDDSTRWVNHSAAGTVGKLAFDILKTGKALGAFLNCKLVVEYLKTLKNYKGFVLTDFPNTVTEAALLEYLITGIPVQTNLKIEKNIEEFVFNQFIRELDINPDFTAKPTFSWSNLLAETQLEVIPTSYDIQINNQLSELPVQEECSSEEDEDLLKETDFISFGNFSGSRKFDRVMFSENSTNDGLGKDSEHTKDEKDMIETDLISDNESNLIELEQTSEEIALVDDYHSVMFQSIEGENIGAIYKNLSEQSKEAKSTSDSEEDELQPESDSNPDIKEGNITSKKKIYHKWLNLRTTNLLPKPADFGKDRKSGQLFLDSCIANFTEQQPKVNSSSATLYHSINSLTGQEKGDRAYKELIPPLNFYKSYGILKTVLHTGESLDLKQVARAILHETRKSDDPMRIGSDELFGKNEHIGLDNYRRGKSSRSPQRASSISQASFQEVRHPKRKLREKRKTNVGQTNILSQEKLVSMTSGIFEGSPPPDYARPGEKGWIYSKLAIPDDIQKSLATHWEIIENVYLQSLHMLMHLLRIHKAKFFPYRNYIREIREKSINIPDIRQNMVADFQSTLNNISKDLRKDSEMKTQLQCNLLELWNTLCELADKNKRLLESEWKKLMKKGWVLQYCYTLINLYLSLIQTEVDRCIDTMQLLNDYYLHMLKDAPKIKQIGKVQLQKIFIPGKKDKANLGTCKKNRMSDDKIFVNENFNMKNLTNLALPAMQKAMSKANQCVYDVKQMINEHDVGVEIKLKYNPKITSDDDVYLFGFLQNQCLSPDVLLAIDPHQYMKYNRKPARLNPHILYLENLNMDQMDEIDRLKLEWFYAVQNEGDRLLFRLKLIEWKINEDMGEYFNMAKAMYKEFETDVIVKYHHEMKAIQQLYNVLKYAIDSETTIESKLVLDGEKFYSGDFTYGDLIVPPPTPLENVSVRYRFKMSQLAAIITKMNQVAPNGVVEDSFIAILEDMAAFTTEDYQPYLPVNWSKMDNYDIRHVLEQAFGNVGVYNWKDFVLFNMNIPKPSVEELSTLKSIYIASDKKSTECVTYDLFSKTPLWFETKYGNERPPARAKDILFKLFQKNAKEMNYSSFLLAFCKGEDSLDGFMTALTLVDKKGILMDAIAHKKKFNEEKKAYKLGANIVVQLVHEAVSKTDGITVKTVPYGKDTCSEGGSSEKLSLSDELSTANSVQSDPAIFPERYNHPKWHVCVPYNIVLSLLIIACNFSHLFGKHLERLAELKENLKELYTNQGSDGLIKAYILAESDFMKNLFELTGIYKWCDLDKYVEKYMEQKINSEQFINKLTKLSIEKTR